MKLKEILVGLDKIRAKGELDVEVSNISSNSKEVKKGDMFVVINGFESNGAEYIEEAIQNGAEVIMAQNDIDKGTILKIPDGITIVLVENVRHALAISACNFYKNPSRKFKLIGVTGTKGKTTTTFMIKDILEKQGFKVGLVGTICTYINGKNLGDNDRTTPESLELQKLFSMMVEEKTEVVVMEVSSQGLKQNRVAGIQFDYGVFTNIEPDHIGPNEHADFNEYAHCKGLLLKQCKHGIINADADFLDKILDGHTCDIETYGIDNECDLKANDIELFTKPGCLCVSYNLSGELSFPVEIHIPGKFSVYNSLCAIAICKHFTNSIEDIKKALIDVKVKGRVEIIPVSKRFTLMIDYAHNAMSLESLITSLKEYNPKRIVTLFGCGGNRSAERRFEMGEVSSKLSDLTIVTSDNPRFEEPMDIINDIITGIKKADGEYVVVPDRKEAIKYAIVNANDGDVIVLAGKGHEDYQEIKGVKYPMDERVLIDEIINEDEVKKIL